MNVGVVGKRGSALFTVAAGNVAVLGLRFNNDRPSPLFRQPVSNLFLWLTHK
jgi:hypothetical protein